VAGLDLLGMILGPLAFASLSYGINEGATGWTSTNALAGLIGGVVLLAAFVVAELRASQPLLELRVFRSIDFSATIVVQWVSMIALFGGIYLLPLFLQQVRNFGAYDTGRIMMAQAIAAGIFMPIGGRLFDRIGARPLAVVGLSLVTVGTYMLTSLSATTSGGDLILSLVLRGMGMGLMMMAVNTHLLNAAPRKLVGRVTSLTQALQNVVTSLAVAGLTTVITTRPSYQMATNLIAHAKQAHPAAVAASQGSLPPLIANLFASAFNDAMKLVVIAGIVGILLAFTLRPNPAAQQAEAPAGSTEEGAAALEMAG
jgi:MFS family permease